MRQWKKVTMVNNKGVTRIEKNPDLTDFNYVGKLGKAQVFFQGRGKYEFKLGEWVKIKNSPMSPIMMIVDIDFDYDIITCSWYQGQYERAFLKNALERFVLKI